MTTDSVDPAEAPTRLEFGIDKGHPTAWGARAIFTRDGYVDFVWNRKDSRGPNRKKLLKALSGDTLHVAFQNAKQLRPSEFKEIELYRDDTVVIIANPRKSFGYLYIGAYLTEDEAEVTTSP